MSRQNFQQMQRCLKGFLYLVVPGPHARAGYVPGFTGKRSTVNDSTTYGKGDIIKHMIA